MTYKVSHNSKAHFVSDDDEDDDDDDDDDDDHCKKSIRLQATQHHGA